MCLTKVNEIKTFISITIVVVQSLRKVHDDRLVISTNIFMQVLMKVPLEKDRAPSFHSSTSSPPHTHTYEVHPQQAQIKECSKTKDQVKDNELRQSQRANQEVKNKFMNQLRKT